MRANKITSSLICAVVLVVSVPSYTFAQTPIRPATPNEARSSSDEQSTRKQSLKTAVAEAIARSRSDNTKEELKRLANGQVNAQSQQKHGLPTREKVLIISIVAGLVVLAVVLAVATGKGGHTFCGIDPTDPDCLPSQ
ncbi:MAG: hypothetical protein C5B55_04495 [Blastocatellia bacterium]|nr:MAG: hypothetical protein C5B55_04495 [Blastocatellia bacterium]